MIIFDSWCECRVCKGQKRKSERPGTPYSQAGNDARGLKLAAYSRPSIFRSLVEVPNASHEKNERRI